jgi:hypothetical protein
VLALPGAAALLLGTLLLGRTVMRRLPGSESERQTPDVMQGCQQAAIGALPLSVAFYDSHDRLLMFNEAAKDMVPYRYRGKLIGQTFETIIRRCLQRGAI